MENTVEKKEEFVFFFGGNFSQWAPTSFVIDGVEFCTAEQYMMYKKALMFHDYETASKIMKTRYNGQKLGYFLEVVF